MKGVFNWPSTRSGQRRYIRCPHSYKNITYGYQECHINMTSKNKSWEHQNIEMCPNPPLTQLFDELEKEYVSITNIRQL